MKVQPLGVSVVICCYNSAQRLPETLAHLAAQEVPDRIPWEVVVVDNASTDDTAAVARNQWPDEAPTPLRVVHEPQSGLSHARKRGFSEATYEYISFVDDDNWVSATWIETIYRVMSEHPEVGACGGMIEAVPEVHPPTWFKRYKNNYAVGSIELKGDITCYRQWLLGAGLTLRKQAWTNLKEYGFKSLLSDRQGKSLTSGGDFELCFVLVMAGWRLWYEPDLQLKHFIPKRRLTWEYMRRLHQGFGRTTVVHEVYLAHLKDKLPRKPRSWWREGLNALWKAAYYYLKALQEQRATRTAGFEGCHAIINFEHKIGRAYELWRRKGMYDESFELIGALYQQLCDSALARSVGQKLQTNVQHQP